MKEITILSGKGGTGKTSLTAALASLAQNAIFCDNDVNAADLHLILQPKIEQEFVYDGAWLATIDQNKCINCNICLENCRFDAIHNNGAYTVNPFQCEGCRLCERLCPTQAITSSRNDKSRWYISATRFGKMVHARLAPGEENSGKLITLIRKKTKEIAQETNIKYIINDGPPGIGCSAISSITGTDLAVVIIESTKTGWHDAWRLIELAKSFNIPVKAIINKSDINTVVTNTIENELAINAIPLMAKLPFDTVITEAMIEEKTVIEYQPNSTISRQISDIWQQLSTPEN